MSAESAPNTNNQQVYVITGTGPEALITDGTPQGPTLQGELVTGEDVTETTGQAGYASSEAPAGVAGQYQAAASSRDGVTVNMRLKEPTLRDQYGAKRLDGATRVGEVRPLGGVEDSGQIRQLGGAAMRTSDVVRPLDRRS
jgi:hypothetical protein